MIGGFQVGPFQTNYQQVAPTPTPTPTSSGATLGGTKARKKVRGPYWDPAVYEAYIQRCIAERNAPRADVAVAKLKEALVEIVEERQETGYSERDALLAENQILMSLLRLERAKRDVRAMLIRQRQIEMQIEEIEAQELGMLLAIFDEME